MNEAMDEADRAKAHKEFDTALALALFREGQGIKPSCERIINAFCAHEDCGDPIPESRRKASTAGDILYCIDCQERLEREARMP